MNVRPQRAADILEDFAGKESDLAFVVVLIVEEAVTANAVPGYALDLIHLMEGVCPGLLVVMAEEIMAGRDEEMADCECIHSVGTLYLELCCGDARALLNERTAERTLAYCGPSKELAKASLCAETGTWLWPLRTRP